MKLTRAILNRQTVGALKDGQSQYNEDTRSLGQKDRQQTDRQSDGKLDLDRSVKEKERI